MVDPENIDYTRTAWIQTYAKHQIIECLTYLELTFDANDSIDVLRKILRTHIKLVHKEREKQRDTAEGNTVDPVNNEIVIVHTMAEYNPSSSKVEFSLGKDDWETYTERLDLYFLANDVKDEKKVPILLTKISPETYKLARDLCAPAKPGTKTYDELVKVINDHLNPKPSETMERYKFN